MRISVFVPKLNTDPIVLLGKQFFPQPIVLLLLPLLRQEILDGRVAAQEGTAVAPDGGRGVGSGHCRGVSRVPEGLGGFDFLVGGFEGEGRFVLCHDTLPDVANGRWASWGGMTRRGQSGDASG